MGRLEGAPSGIERLDQVLYDDSPISGGARVRRCAHPRLRQRPRRGGHRRTLRYRNMAGEAQETPLAWTLAHFFNHQTHHRGQVHGMLSGTPVAPPPLDLIYFLRQDRD
jgi:uncharacterized damage-inducible protein DinB